MSCALAQRLEKYNTTSDRDIEGVNLDYAGTTFFNFQENSGSRRTLAMLLNIQF